ncbi:MAG TPA: VWA domain-containing protein [Pyrinomonadaceae bacterium]|nr:VWA domain-containing protein [Pyrinomonadaceae bacterium]
MNKKVYLTGTLLLAVSSALAQAQEVTKPNQGDEKIISATNLVTVNVIVTDGNGNYVKGLRRDQFEVSDEKVKQQIAHFSDEAAPVSFGIVCELHNAPSAKTRAMLASVKQFTSGLDTADDFFFMAFGKQGSVTAEFVPTAAQVLDHLASVKPGGPASLYDAVYLAADRLRKSRNLKKTLLIVSDGEDESSRTTFKELRNRLREFDVQVYALGIANPAIAQSGSFGRWEYEDVTRQSGRRHFSNEASLGRAVLAEMARVSGGATYFPESENEPELAGIFAQISLELRHQYTIGFYPPEQTTNKEWHRIRVRANAGSRPLELSYRQGYRRVNR